MTVLQIFSTNAYKNTTENFGIYYRIGIRVQSGQDRQKIRLKSVYDLARNGPKSVNGMSKIRHRSGYNRAKIGSGLGESQVMIRPRFRLKSGNNLAKIRTGLGESQVIIQPRLDQNLIMIWPR